MLPSVTLGRSLTGPELLFFPTRDSFSDQIEIEMDTAHRDDDNTKHSETTDRSTQRVREGRQYSVDDG
jgi:hypothetical protein